MFNVLIVLCLLPVIEVFSANVLPSYIKICKRQAELAPCLKENAELCRPHLEKGIPELHIPPLVPFNLPQVALQRGDFSLDIKDMVIKGLDTFELMSMDFKLDGDFSMYIDVNLPSLWITGLYTFKGKILMLELNGHGPGEANTTDLRARIDLTGNKITKKGMEYAEVTDGKIVLNFNGPISVYFHNLFGDRDELTKATNEVIQDNIKEFVKEVQPIMENIIFSFVTGILKQIFNKFSLDELFQK